MEGVTVFKQIKNFEEYAKRQKTSFAAIKKAYAAAEQGADEAKRNGQPQYLVSCSAPPRLVRQQRYEVRTLPCGYVSHVSSERVSSCCLTQQTLNRFVMHASHGLH